MGVGLYLPGTRSAVCRLVVPPRDADMLRRDPVKLLQLQVIDPEPRVQGLPGPSEAVRGRAGSLEPA